MRHDKHSAIGVFDSGVGGLTVLKALMERLPIESTVYLGDTARVPYGTKSAEVVTRYSLKNAELLLEYGIKLLPLGGYVRLMGMYPPATSRPKGRLGQMLDSVITERLRSLKYFDATRCTSSRVTLSWAGR